VKKEDIIKVVLIIGIVITATSAAYIFSNPPANPIKESVPEGEERGNTSSEKLTGDGDGVLREEAPEDWKGSEGEDALSPSRKEMSSTPLIPALLLVALSALIIPLALSVLSSKRALSDSLREDILAYLNVFPGATPRELCEEFQLSPSAINHHIRMLERWGRVYTVKTQKHIYVFPSHTSYTEASKMAETMETVGGLNDNVLRVLRAVLEGAQTQNEIAERTSLPASTISYVLKKLVNAGLVKSEKENGRTLYSPLYENIYRLPRLGLPLTPSPLARQLPEEDLQVS